MVSTDLVVIPPGVRTRDWPRAVQCSRVKDDGQQCRRRATRGARVCFVHGAKLPSVKAAAENEVTELRTRALSIADRALDVVEDALEHQDPNVRLRASAQLLDRVMPRQQAGTTVLVDIGPGADGAPIRTASEVIRERLASLHARQAQPEPSAEPETWEGSLAEHAAVVPWDGEPVEGQLLNGGAGEWS